MDIIIGILALAAAVLSYYNNLQIKELHVSVNSRLSQLLESVKAVGNAEGRRQLVEEQKHTMRMAPIPNQPESN